MIISREERDGTSSDKKEDTKKLSVEDLKKKDYYKVLGLEDLKWQATEDQIRSAYRKLVLKYHPDKIAEPSEEDRQIFIHIQDAYDTLGNTEKRRAYGRGDRWSVDTILRTWS